MTTVGASEATIDFQTKAKYVLAGALLALLTGGILIMAAYALDWWGLDDRPPIIVKNGSVVIENQPFKGKSTGPGWTDDGQDWNSDQQNANDVDKYVVGVVGGVSGTCEDLEGKNIVIDHSGSGAPLTFKVAGKQPKIGPRGQLMPDTSYGLKRLKFGNADVRPTKVSVYDNNPGEAQSCELGVNSQVWIWPVQ